MNMSGLPASQAVQSTAHRKQSSTMNIIKSGSEYLDNRGLDALYI